MDFVVLATLWLLACKKEDGKKVGFRALPFCFIVSDTLEIDTPYLFYSICCYFKYLSKIACLRFELLLMMAWASAIFASWEEISATICCWMLCNGTGMV